MSEEIRRPVMVERVGDAVIIRPRTWLDYMTGRERGGSPLVACGGCGAKHRFVMARDAPPPSQCSDCMPFADFTVTTVWP